MALLVGVLFLCFHGGWVCYSANRECARPRGPVNEARFLSAHGLTKENFSIWLREHSVWRRKYSDELRQYSFIPDGYEHKRKHP